ncbi:MULTISPECIES: hypothetical protein [unclassified Bradyrhizobium]|uniref:hypothetical protein n=1 Tax=unclassified Bradyrhizobium TaxID=2631580 RepID=UPI001CD40C5F|nr:MULTISPECIES: hypothetical protein [unclassified Bradyrhizobium]MCA1427329.1 hypothetical protein [Bradyrhizobium sp. NBAIM16]MCA1506849.1 hypothetical protein [Bradyrhizobium sp. NBAIM02]
MAAIITRENIQPPKIEEGDAGIILKADGTFRVFNTIADPTKLIPAQIEQGKKLLALAAVLKDPEILKLITSNIGAFGDVLSLKMDS